MPKPALRHREHELLVRAELGVALRRQLDAALRSLRLGVGLRCAFRHLGALGATHGERLLEVGLPLAGRRPDVAQDGHRDDLVAVVEPDAAHAGRSRGP